MSYDVKCERLADAFLEEYRVTDQKKQELAQEIQDTIEDYIRFEVEPKGVIK